MKKITLFRTLSVLFLSLLVSSASADVWLLASGGDDANDGSTKEKGVATLFRATQLLAFNAVEGIDNRVIIVSGIVDISDDPMFNKTLDGNANDLKGVPLRVDNRGWGMTIRAEEELTDKRELAERKSGFTSKNQGRLFNELAGYGAPATGPVTIKDLIFTEMGKPGQGDGGALYILNNNAKITIDNCEFTGIKANSGVMRVYNSNADIINCWFHDNEVREGGAILCNSAQFENNRHLLIQNCLMESNNGGALDLSGNPYTNGRGGAIYLENARKATIKNCIIRNNVTHGAGGAIWISANGDAGLEPGTGGSTGVEAAYKVSEITVENTLIAYNETTNNNGGAFWVQNNSNPASTPPQSLNLTVVNSTIFGNQAGTATQGGQGGAFMFDNVTAPLSSFNLINCTVSDNAASSNAGGGPGLRFFNTTLTLKKNIYNSIIENNVSPNTLNTTGDIATQSADDVNRYFLNIQNSYIGAILSDSYKQENLPETNHGFYSTSEIISEAGLADASMIDLYNAIPLSPDVEALTFGNAEYLQELGITTDQLGLPRLFADGKCAIGALEYDYFAIDEEIDKLADGIEVAKQAPAQLSLVQKGSSLYLLSSEAGLAKLDLFSISGALVKSYAPQAVELPYALGVLPQGLYIAKVTVGGQAYSAKVIIK
ncbi:right-handed parallel beta-helix repeat-containing protein [Viscerimonas tarda]